MRSALEIKEAERLKSGIIFIAIKRWPNRISDTAALDHMKPPITKPMLKKYRSKLLPSAIMILSGDAAHADFTSTSNVVSGSLHNTGIGIVFFVIAAIVLFALLSRSSAVQVTKLFAATMGERRLRNALKQSGRDALHDFDLPGAFGGIAHIDHALLTKGGIICIETKHCNGTVFGKSDDPQWTNIDGPLRQKFLNPLIQNEGRTRALQKVAPGVPVRNLVVFTGRVSFASEPNSNVIHIDQLNSYITKFKFGPCQIGDWDAVALTVRSAVIAENSSHENYQSQVNLS